jgi:hypothetical protein
VSEHRWSVGPHRFVAGQTRNATAKVRRETPVEAFNRRKVYQMDAEYIAANLVPGKPRFHRLPVMASRGSDA